MEGYQMRVMRVMAGNFPTNVNKVSKEKIYVYVDGWKSPRNHPHHPQVQTDQRYSLGFFHAGNSHRVMPLGCDFLNEVTN